MDINKLLSSFKEKEDGFLERDFIAPSLPNSDLYIKIDGVTLNLKPDRVLYDLGVFKPISYKEARFVRRPTKKERMEYMSIFKTVDILMRSKNRGLYIKDNKIKDVYVLCCDGLTCFDFIKAKFNGQCFIYERPNNKNLTIVNKVRECVGNLDKSIADDLKEPLLSLFLTKYEEEKAARIPPEEQLIKNQLIRAGAKLNKWKKVGGQYVIDYTIKTNNGDFKNTSTVNEDMSVALAGICLGHGNQNMVTNGLLDLNSLVSVTKEAVEKGRIVRGNYR